MRPSRRDLLLQSAALLGAPRFAFGQGTGGADAKHLIVVFAEGGWDVTYGLDPKLSCIATDGGPCAIQGPELDEDRSNPDDREAVQTFGSIPVVVNDVKRPNVRAFFERWHGRSHVVNGVWTGSIAHDPCRTRLLTGTPDGTHADLATIAGYTFGGALPLGSVDLSGWSIAGPLASSTGRLGFHSQIAALIDDGSSFRAPAGVGFEYPLFDLDPTDEASVETFVRSRVDALRSRFSDGGGRNDRVLDDLLVSMDRGDRFRDRSQEILASLRLGIETSFTEQLGMAVDLIEAGLCHAVTIDTREEWDTHSANVTQHTSYDRTFAGLSALLADLEGRAMLDQVVVAVISEMTRTPLRNSADGKDHWGHTSAMLLGAVRGDATSGRTTELLESEPMNLATGEVDPNGELCKYDNLCAGILELAGVDPGDWLPGVQPFRGASA
ncbi:MAG: DUF1501 domain-containing protein [Myxococcota bacterium]